jgi:DNA-binding MarR family transcriptional regulator
MDGTAKARAPTTCTCFHLRKAARRVSQIYDQFLEPHGLTVTQYGLLAHLRAFDGVGIGCLAQKLVMDPTTLTRNLRPLVRRGLVRSTPDDGDRRNRKLSLTAAGRTAWTRARPGWEGAQRRVADALGAEQRAALAAIIDAMLAEL